MSKNNLALKFQNEESFKLVKDNLTVEFLNPVTMLAVSEKAIASIGYWESRKLKNATKEQVDIYNVEIAKLEALMQRMTDLSLDVYTVNAEAYLDNRGDRPDNSVEEVLTEIGEKADTGSGAPVVENEGKSVSIFDGNEMVEKPSIDDLKQAVKQLIKKGKFDSANLLATQYLSVGNYTPVKANKKAEKWTEARIAGWIRDMNNVLMEEKRPADKVHDTPKLDVAAKGLTTGEVENLRLLAMIIPETISGHQDHESRREVLKKYLTLGKTLNDEDEMLWAIGKRALGASTAKLPENDLADLYKDLEAFCKVFFAHRGYTEKSVKAWREAIATKATINNFEYLTTGKDIDPKQLKKSNISVVAIDTRVKEGYEAGKTVEEISKGLEEGMLYKVIPGTEKGADYKIYTKLHLLDLISRMYSAYSTKAPAVDKDLKTSILVSDKVDVSAIKTVIATLIENGGLLEDVKTHPDILGLVNKEIIDGTTTPSMKYGNEETLFPWIETIFTEISKTVKVKVASNEEVEEELAIKFANLDDLLLICGIAAKNDVSQEDFIKENKDLVLNEDGTYKSLKSFNKTGGSKTIVVASAKDFENWVADVYKIQEKVKENDEVVSSMKELKTKGDEILSKGTTYERFIEWLNKNLLNRKMREQKPGGEFKDPAAVVAFAKTTFDKKLPKPEKVEDNVESVSASSLTEEEIIAVVTEKSKDPKVVFAQLARELRDLYVANDIKINEATMTAQQAIDKLEEIMKDSNQPAYVARMQRKAEAEARKEAANTAAQGKLPFTKETNEEAEVDEPIVGEVNEEETVEADAVLFEKVDLEKTDPNLWKLIKTFTTMEQIHNQAIEYLEHEKFNEALSLCLVMVPKVEASKDWTPEQITHWFNTNVLNKPAEPVVTDKVENVETKEKIELGEEFKGLMESTNKKTTSQTVMAILKAHEDNAELRNKLIAAFRTGKGSHTRTVGKMPDGELHKYINNQKEKIGKYAKAETE